MLSYHEYIEFVTNNFENEKNHLNKLRKECQKKLYFLSQRETEYNLAVKQILLHKIFQKLLPNVQYKANHTPNKLLIQVSKLINSVEGLIADDLFMGEYKGIQFNFFDLKTKSFNGLFFELIYPKKFVTEISPARELGPPLILEDQLFNKYFSPLYSSNSIDAFQILTNDLTRVFVEFYENVHPLKFSFVGNRIFLAIDFQGDSFEASLAEDINKLDFYSEIYHDFSLLFKVIDQLGLATEHKMIFKKEKENLKIFDIKDPEYNHIHETYFEKYEPCYHSMKFWASDKNATQIKETLKNMEKEE